MAEYRIQTEVYNGPLDLLLYLIKRDEVDIYDIPVSRVTEQYCQYVELLKVIDPNVAGDFLVMATVLMEIKSRMLLPRPVTEDGEPDDLTDPRLELVHQLLEYKKFKDASFELADAADLQSRRWPRSPARIKPEQAAEVDLDDALFFGSGFPGVVIPARLVQVLGLASVSAYEKGVLSNGFVAVDERGFVVPSLAVTLCEHSVSPGVVHTVLNYF